MTSQDLILTLDVGTTNCRAAVLNKHGQILALAFEPILLISPERGWFEICPHGLWGSVCRLIGEVTAGYEGRLATCGITVQRSTFVTWNRDTGEYLHNLITWMDRRSSEMCDSWNSSLLVTAGKWAAWALGRVIRSRHMVCASTFSVKEKAVPMRLKWVMENVPAAAPLQKQGKLRFGTVDTWLVWKLTGGRVWATDHSCASSTGIFDIWKGCWCPVMCYVFSNPTDALPEIRDSNSHFGDIDSCHGFGFTIPITGVIGDQQASIFGNLLFEVGDMKLTLGTGIACNVNTGTTTHPTSHDIYPLIGWKLAHQPAPFYVAELLSANGGRAVEWAVTSGLVEHISQIDQVADSVPDSGGVSFIPAFNGMEVPYRDPFVGTTLTGITLLTRREHMVRAVLESQAFISSHMLGTMCGYYGRPGRVRVDGGASRSDFIVRGVVGLSGGVQMERAESVEGSLLGAGLLAGLGAGIYQSLDDIKTQVGLKMTNFGSEAPSYHPSDPLATLSEAGQSEGLEEAFVTWGRSAEKCAGSSRR